MRRIRTIAVLPTMFTMGNLVCGFFSIVVAARIDAPTTESIAQELDRERSTSSSPRKSFRSSTRTDPTQNVMLSGWLIFLAMIFDALDGHVARLSRATSDFGAQLDSLCDVVTFGVAPGFLLVKMCPTALRFSIAMRSGSCVLRLPPVLHCAWRDSMLRPARTMTICFSAVCHHRLLPRPRSPALRFCFTNCAAKGNALANADTIDHAIQWILALLRRDCRAADGLADSLSARRESGVPRTKKFRPRRWLVVCLGGR